MDQPSPIPTRYCRSAAVSGALCHGGMSARFGLLQPARQLVCSPGETADGRSSHGLDRVLREKKSDWQCDTDDHEQQMADDDARI